jgi:syntaxin-binding protein 5
MDLLIGGPDRPPSTRQLAQDRADAEHQRLQDRRAGRSASGVPATGYPSYPTAASNSGAEEGWGAWASRTLNERTEKLGLAGDSMDQLSSNSKGWADDVNKFVGKQKRGFVMGAVKSKFGF